MTVKTLEKVHVVVACAIITIIACTTFLSPSPSSALQRATGEEIEGYRVDGTYRGRLERSRALGNHRPARHLMDRLHREVQRIILERQGLAPGEAESQFAPPPSDQGGMPTTGTVNVLGLLIDFSDYPHYSPNTPAQMNTFVFGSGNGNFPYESLTNYYSRSSYSQLTIQGTLLGWWAPAYSRSSMAQTVLGRQTLIAEAISYFDTTGEGHDFSRYDNDGDGDIDYFFVIWSGPDNGWGNFWWGYQTSWNGSVSSLNVDGVSPSTYSWQWEHRSSCSPSPCTYSGPYDPHALIHETGHALGLPDYYDYDGDVGPDGGVGGLDMMDANWGDHNSFSKMLLGWIDPFICNKAGTSEAALNPGGTSQDALLIMPDAVERDPFGEFFIVQNRYRSGNDNDLSTSDGNPAWPTDGLTIWHVDSRLDSLNHYLYDNSFTSHKLLRLMEADGLEEIGLNSWADAGDFYTAGESFTPATAPNSDRYDGTPSGISVSGITGPSGSAFELNITLTSGRGGGKVLFDQLGSVLSIGTISQNFAETDPYPYRDHQLADDFTLSEDAIIEKVGVQGFFNNHDGDLNSFTGGPVTSVTLSFFEDGSGIPGSLLYSETVVPDAPAESGWSLSLAAPLVLTAGTYWLGVQADMNYSPGGKIWYWRRHRGGAGSEYAWRWFPDLGSAWTGAGNGDDLSFRLTGRDIPLSFLVLDFGSETGTWARYEGDPASWRMIVYLSPEDMIAADLDGNGKDEVVLDFGAGTGVWANYNNHPTSWGQITDLDPEDMEAADLDNNGKDELIMDFGAGVGVWANYNNDPASWGQIVHLDPESMVTADLDGNSGDEIVMDFGAGVGVWANYNNDPANWGQITNLDPEDMVMTDLDDNSVDEVLFDFGAGVGVWANYNNNPASWGQITNLDPEDMVTTDLDSSGKEEVILDFGAGNGVWAYFNDDPVSWEQIIHLDPENMETCHTE